MAIEDWMGTLRDRMEGVAGIEAAYIYDDLPGTLMTFPCMVIMPLSGGQEYSAGGPAVGLHQVQLTLYLTNQILPEAFGAGVPYIKLVRNKLAANVTLGAKVSYILPPPVEEPFYQGPGSVRYGDKEHAGIIFRAVVKEIEVVTVSA